MTSPSPDLTAGASRERALAALLATGPAVAPTPDTPAEPGYTRTGREVEAGGAVARLLIRPSTLAYRDGGLLHYADARVGDIVLLTARAAARLDELGATVDPSATEAEVDEALDGEVTDEQLRLLNAAPLVAYVAENPDDRERVRALELERPENKRRATVLAATEPTPTEDDEAARIAAERSGLDADVDLGSSEDEQRNATEADLAALAAAGGAGIPDGDGTVTST